MQHAPRSFSAASDMLEESSMLNYARNVTLFALSGDESLAAMIAGNRDVPFKDSSPHCLLVGTGRMGSPRLPWEMSAKRYERYERVWR